MTDSINCKYARCGVHSCINNNMVPKKLPRGGISAVVREYNDTFKGFQAIKVTPKVASNKFLAIFRAFSRKWHPQSMKSIYMNTFGVENWNNVPEEEKSRHSIQNCTICSEMTSECSKAFPTPVRRGRKIIVRPTSQNITLTEKDLTSPKSLGRKVFNELNTISKDQFNVTAVNVLTQTPKSHLVLKPTTSER